MSSLACFGKLSVKRGIVSPRLFTQSFELLFTLPQVLIHGVPICSIERQRAARTGILYNLIESIMPSETTYTSLRENLASVLDQVVDQQETVIVRRRGARDVALIPATELAGLMETAHLLRSPRNARRLLSALRRAKAGNVKPGTAAALGKEMLGEARR